MSSRRLKPTGSTGDGNTKRIVGERRRGENVSPRRRLSWSLVQGRLDGQNRRSTSARNEQTTKKGSSRRGVGQVQSSWNGRALFRSWTRDFGDAAQQDLEDGRSRMEEGAADASWSNVVRAAVDGRLATSPGQESRSQHRTVLVLWHRLWRRRRGRRARDAMAELEALGSTTRRAEKA